MKWISLLFSGLVLACTLEAKATSGPEVPCYNCGPEAHFSEPSSGLWFNPDRSGSGIAIQMQSGLLLGAVYTFTAHGEAIWFTFFGRLEQQEGADYTLKLRASLQRYEQGACFECEQTESPPIEDIGDISLEFSQRNYGSFAIDYADGTLGEKQSIVPLVAGVELARDFPALDYLLPDLSGDWTFVLDNPSVELQWGVESSLLHIGAKSVQLDASGNTRRIRYSFRNYGGLGPEISDGGELTCSIESGPDPDPIPSCNMDVVSFAPGVEDLRLSFPLPVANIGADRIEAVDPETGVRVKAFRVAFD